MRNLIIWLIINFISFWVWRVIAMHFKHLSISWPFNNYNLSFLYFQKNLTHLPRSEYVPGIGLGIAKCPYDPLDNSTAIYVENGNPGGLPALVSRLEMAWLHLKSSFTVFIFGLSLFFCFELSLQNIILMKIVPK